MQKILLAFFVCISGVVSAHTPPVNLSNTPGRPSRGFTEENDDFPTRNHGTGLRVGTAWMLAQAAVRQKQMPRAFEIGVFHQRALSEAVSIQGEAVYYRDATATTHSSGFRLPALLVLNPFDNLNIHFGPQLQVRTGGTAPRALSAETEVPVAAATPRLTGGLVVGAEARAGILRIGVRYALPLGDLVDLKSAGQQVGSAWQSGQVQAYLGAGF